MRELSCGQDVANVEVVVVCSFSLLPRLPVVIADFVSFVAGQMPSLYCPWPSVKIQTINEQYKN